MSKEENGVKPEDLLQETLELLSHAKVNLKREIVDKANRENGLKAGLDLSVNSLKEAQHVASDLKGRLAAVQEENQNLREDLDFSAAKNRELRANLNTADALDTHLRSSLEQANNTLAQTNNLLREKSEAFNTLAQTFALKHPTAMIDEGTGEVTFDAIVNPDVNINVVTGVTTPARSASIFQQEVLAEPPTPKDIKFAKFDPEAINAMAARLRALRVAVIIGHDELSQGAFSKFLDTSEWEFWNSKYDNLNFESLYEYAERLGIDLSVDKILRDRRGVITAHEEIENQADYDIAIELHFNAFASDSVNGAEILLGYVEHDEQMEIATGILNNWCRTMDIRNRGVKYPGPTNAGHFNVNNLRDNMGIDIPYLLLEPFFGSNYSDSSKVFIDDNPLNFFLREIVNYYAYGKVV